MGECGGCGGWWGDNDDNDGMTEGGFDGFSAKIGSDNKDDGVCGSGIKTVKADQFSAVFLLVLLLQKVDFDCWLSMAPVKAVIEDEKVVDCAILTANTLENNNQNIFIFCLVIKIFQL